MPTQGRRPGLGSSPVTDGFWLVTLAPLPSEHHPLRSMSFSTPVHRQSVYTPIRVVGSHLLSTRDLWVTNENCDIGCSRSSTYDAASSPTFQNLSQPFTVTYGSGQAAGDLVLDVVQMAGFSVQNQVFGAVSQVSQGLLSSPVSGLLGLGWQSIASSGQPPLWQTLASKGAWSQPVMGFQLTRYALRLIYVECTHSAVVSFLNDSTARPLDPGGSFTMGGLKTCPYLM